MLGIEWEEAVSVRERCAVLQPQPQRCCNAIDAQLPFHWPRSSIKQLTVNPEVQRLPDHVLKKGVRFDRWTARLPVRQGFGCAAIGSPLSDGPCAAVVRRSNLTWLARARACMSGQKSSVLIAQPAKRGSGVCASDNP